MKIYSKQSGHERSQANLERYPEFNKYNTIVADVSPLKLKLQPKNLVQIRTYDHEDSNHKQHIDNELAKLVNYLFKLINEKPKLLVT
jgi:hypothetical protein